MGCPILGRHALLDDGCFRYRRRLAQSPEFNYERRIYFYFINRYVDRLDYSLEMGRDRRAYHIGRLFAICYHEPKIDFTRGHYHFPSDRITFCILLVEITNHIAIIIIDLQPGFYPYQSTTKSIFIDLNEYRR